jgi:hypothetical protein
MMAPQTLAARVERLEERVTTLEQLPARVDALTEQILQFREEVRIEFSATHAKIDALDSRLTVQIDSVKQELSVHMRVLHEETLSRLALMQEAQASRKQLNSPE